MFASFDIGASASQASHVPEAVLLQDGRKVRLGDIVREGAVAEDYGTVTGGFELLACHSAIPRASGSTSSQVIFSSRQAINVHGADGAHGLARDGPGFDGHAEIEPEFE